MSAVPEQADVIAFLASPSSYPGQPAVTRLETHGNLIFLAGDDAWKIKRAVHFPYMDFSTRERRHAACQAELEVNRRLAADLYLGCVAIVRAPDGHLAFGGDGEVVEHAVHMRRFAQDDLLSARCPDRISDADAHAVAEAVLASHAAAPVSGDADGCGRVQRLLQSLRRTLLDLQFADGAAVETWAQAAGAALENNRGLLDARARSGFVRRCHADLHAANIVFWQGRPLLFDAIEFDPQLATIDVLYDLAFLLMDLARRGAHRPANLIFNRYLWRSPEEMALRGLALLPLFMSLRAAVRAMVSAERAAQGQDADRERDLAAARDLLAFAQDLLSPRLARLVAVAGLSGTGKTTLASHLAPAFAPAPGAVHLRSDVIRKALAQVAETDRLPQESYSLEASRRVYATLLRQADVALAAGAPVILDAVAARPEERASFAELAARHAVRFDGLWLAGGEALLSARVDARTGDASDATSDVVRRQVTWDTGALTSQWRRIDATGSVASTFEQAAGTLALDRPQLSRAQDTP